jgi:hypothetical protein
MLEEVKQKEKRKIKKTSKYEELWDKMEDSI